MAIKHVVTQGIGFTIPNYLLTDGFGDLAAGGGGGGGPSVSERRQRRRRFSAVVLATLYFIMIG